MLELDVTEYVEYRDCREFSDSIANSGFQNIGAITWRNAQNHLAVEPLIQPKDIQDAKDWLKGFGEWDDIDEWPDLDVNALVLQFIAGDVNELHEFGDDEYMRLAEQGTVSGRLYPGDDGKWYYRIGD